MDMRTTAPDMTMATNDWKIHNPKWNDENAPKHVCTTDSHWTGIYCSDYFLQMNNGERVFLDYYCKDKHFYYLWWYGPHDIIFASYSINEIIRFARKLITTESFLNNLYVYDAVTKQHLAFVTDSHPDTWFARLFKDVEIISLGNIKFINRGVTYDG